MLIWNSDDGGLFDDIHRFADIIDWVEEGRELWLAGLEAEF